MAIFGPKLWFNAFGKMSIFRLFKRLVCIAQKGVCLFQNIVRDIFQAYIAERKKVGIMGIFGPKLWVNAFGKMSIFRLFKLLVFIAQKDVFSFQNIVRDIFQAFYSLERRFFVLEYRKRHFPGLYCLKKNIRKMAIFGPKAWVNPLAKMPIFGLFELFVFIAQKGVFSFQNIIEYIFLLYIASKRKLEKMPFLDQNHGLTPLEKCQFLDF